MRKTNLLIASFAATVLLLGGCASNLSGDSYSRDEARTVQNVRMGTIEYLRPVQIEGTKSPVGAGAGAVVGGLGGSTIGGGTGSYYFEAGSGVYNELQCGSYAFMDADYGRILDQNGKRIDPAEVYADPSKLAQGPVQVSPLEFVTMTLEKEHLIGKPLIWAQWPTPEQP